MFFWDDIDVNSDKRVPRGPMVCLDYHKSQSALGIALCTGSRLPLQGPIGNKTTHFSFSTTGADRKQVSFTLAPLTPGRPLRRTFHSVSLGIQTKWIYPADS